MKVINAATSIFLCSLAGSASAASGVMDDVRLFQNYFQDAVTLHAKQLEGSVGIVDNDHSSGSMFGVRGDMPFDDQIDVGASIGFISSEPDGGDSVSGLTDLDLGVRLHWDTPSLDARSDVSVGALLSLPVGDDDIGAGNTEVGGFVAIRHRADERYVLTGMAGLSSVEVDDDRSLSLQIGGGGIYRYTDALYLVSEIVLETETDYRAATFGVDYSTQSDAHFRANVQFGLGDGAADLGLSIGYLARF